MRPYDDLGAPPFTVLKEGANPPLDAYANVPIYQIGTMAIPKINLVHPIFEGVWLTVVDHGPGHWPGSAMPGQRGNSVFAGHRVTHTHPFYDLDLLAPGNRVIFYMPSGTFTYEVTDRFGGTGQSTRASLAMGWLISPVAPSPSVSVTTILSPTMRASGTDTFRPSGK